MDLQELNKLSKIQLANLLDPIQGPKDLVLDADLTKPLDRVAGVSFLRENGVDKIFKLDPVQKFLPGCSKRIYLVRPRMVTMKYIADQINNEMAKGEKRSYKVVMVPRKLNVCEMILESEGVMGHVTIDEFPMELLTLDSDILSMELPDLFTSFYLDNDTTWLQTVASSLDSLQGLFGKIPNVYAIGKCSKMVYDLMQMMFMTHKERKDKKYHIGQLFIVDRDIDLVSPLCSPMTYEALLNETFGIDCSMITFDSTVTGDAELKLLLTSQDEIYSQIRDRHFSHVFSYLSGKAKDLQGVYNKKNSLKTVGDVKEYVAKELGMLKHQQKLLATHIGACEVIMKKKAKEDFEEYIKTEQSLLMGTETKENVAYIEECIHKQFSLILTLRLMCLLSITQEGLSPKDYKSLKTQFLHSHGFEHLVTFFNLKKLGLLTEQEGAQGPIRSIRQPSFTTRKSNYNTINNKLGLVPKLSDDIDFKNPSDMSYVFSGAYSPLPCKLIEQIITRDTLVGLEDIGRMCGGLHSDLKIKNRGLGPGKPAPVIEPAMKVILVYFIGGCTFSEITALRFIAKCHGVTIIVATTAVITSNGLLDGLIEKPAR